jgi:hypothetical protein
MAEQTDKVESQRDMEKRFEQELEDSAEWGAEEKRLRAIRNKRREAGECILCGKPLGFWDKRAKRQQHEKCTKWVE